jgi:hypothetical protein
LAAGNLGIYYLGHNSEIKQDLKEATRLFKISAGLIASSFFFFLNPFVYLPFFISEFGCSIGI